MTNDRDAGRKGPSNEREETRALGEAPFIEWIVGAAGLLLLVGAIVVIVSGDRHATPARIEARLTELEVAPNQVLAHILVRNTGGEAASQVRVVARALQSDPARVRTVEVEFLPPHADREAVLVFETGPAPLTSETLEVRVESYEKP